jgi:hypothetical protein
MNRPIYEKEADLDNEQEVLTRLEKAWKCRGQKLPIRYGADYCLTVEGKIKAWAEIKCRDKKYPEMWVSLREWMAGKELAQVTSRPFLLVYAFNGEIYWKNVENDTPEIVMGGGRTDRGDWQDQEPMAVFLIETFGRLTHG